MKRIFAVALVLALVLVMGASLTAMAAGPNAGQGPQAAGQAWQAGPNFVDADGDGVCDLCTNGGVRPLDGAGQQMRQGANGGQGANFVDEDGDGICDNCANDGARLQDGTGQQMRRGGHGRR